MAQIRLRNATGRTSVRGQLIKLSPNSKVSFMNALPGDNCIIGTVSESVPNGNSCLINLINTVALSDIMGITVSATEPINPKIGDLWFW